MFSPALRHLLALAVALATLSGCTALQEIVALRSVDFEIDRVSNVRVAGIDVAQIRGFSDLSFADAARLAAAVASREAPLALTIHLRAENPASNSVTARLVQMDWTLILEDTETVSGRIERGIELRPGVPTDVPVDVSLDLLDFYERSGPDLVDLALNLAGRGGQPARVSLRAVPAIDTALGPITYPRPITIVAATIGRTE